MSTERPAEDAADAGTVERFTRWQVGDIAVTKVVEATLQAPVVELLPDFSAARIAAAAWLRPDFVTGGQPPMLHMSVHSFLIEANGLRIVVDTCFGSGKERGYPPATRTSGSYPADLAAAGFPVDSVDVVVCTHLHFDHIGWHTRRGDRGWVPTFPNARYLVCGAEWDFWTARYEAGEPPVFDSDHAFRDTLDPLSRSGALDLVEADHQITDGVRLIPTPGHTPGHVAVWLSSGVAQAAVTGDLVHTPVELLDPGAVCSSDLDPAAAAQTRAAFFARCHDASVLVLGTHFAAPTAGALARDGSGWRLVPR